MWCEAYVWHRLARPSPLHDVLLCTHGIRTSCGAGSILLDCRCLQERIWRFVCEATSLPPSRQRLYGCAISCEFHGCWRTRRPHTYGATHRCSLHYEAAPTPSSINASMAWLGENQQDWPWVVCSVRRRISASGVQAVVSSVLPREKPMWCYQVQGMVLFSLLSQSTTRKPCAAALPLPSSRFGHRVMWPTVLRFLSGKPWHA